MRLLMICLFLFSTSLVTTLVPDGRCADNTASEVGKNVGESITTRQESQKELEKWESEKEELLMQYDQLTQEKEMLLALNGSLTEELSQRRRNVEALEAEKDENGKISKEMEPFLKQVSTDLDRFISEDMPFLKEERQDRIARLKNTVEDMSVPVSEKFRKVMEALFVEAEYGNTIEVIRSRIRFESEKEDLLADIFRLGRISMFALTLDRNRAAFYNVADSKWDALPPQYLDTVRGAVEMAEKQRRVDILDMPIGRIISR